ncbi:ABC transporter substrate-binding protein [Opitutales bacterium ASA1]|uniref:peptide ABC transporter substrate-binding protein n=1 Tax=Congregicoccus parvus TaxID=3081749 RepID=UPI002B2D1EA3|nr:ABC transporter substrate-binding protein [Opitutales bacterium ASA1]
MSTPRFVPCRLVGGVFAFLSALVLAGCGPKETRVQQGLREQVLHLGNLSEPADLDPQIITSIQDFHIVMALFEGLMGYHPETAKPVPVQAERWDVSADGRVYTFHLRPDLRWSNGDPVTAHDYLYSYRRMLTPSLGAEYAYMHFVVVGAEAYARGDTTDFSTVGYEALDDRTLRITLREPTPYFLGLLAHSSWYPVHPATVEAHDGGARRGTRWTRVENIVTNGPFVLKDWRPNQFIEVRRNPLHWEAAGVRLQAIRFYPIESADTEERAFRSGQLHVTASIPISKLDVYRRESPELLHVHPILATYIYRFNTRRPPLDDVRVRKALALAIDREAIVERVTRGGQLPAYRFTPPGAGGHDSSARLEGTLEDARRLLAEAGFPEGRGFPSLQLLYNTNEGHRQIAEAVQQMWRVALGIDVGLYNQEAKVYTDTMRNGDYDIARYAWVGDYNDPNTFLDMMVTDGGNNQTGWSNAEFDRLLAEAGRAADEATRFALFDRAEQLLMNEVPFAPVYFYTRNNLRLPMVKGWYGNVLDLHAYNRVYLEDAP